MDDRYEAPPAVEDGAELVQHLNSRKNQHGDSASSMNNSFADGPYRGSSISTIDPTLEQAKLGTDARNGPPADLGRIREQSDHQRAGPGARVLSKADYTEMTSSTVFASKTMDVPPVISPEFDHSSDRKVVAQPHSPAPPERLLPRRDVTDETLDDAYVAFILYCNPVVLLSTDSMELRRGFRTPPKSDGNTFNTFTLLELIRKFESKEIKTWTQLAIQLGVEPPAMEKNQSAQKVQQYAVRLKRWMHAMHVDAFFEYCLGKPHNYYTQVPPAHAPYPEFGRDGVPLEEDLALRALHPESRPKRGRRKTEDKDNDSDKGSTPAKRPQLDTSVGAVGMHIYGGSHPSMFHNSANTPSVMPAEEMERYNDHLDPWTAASAVTGQAHSANPTSGVGAGQHFRWRLNTRDPNTPLTPHPRSAVTPSTGQPPDSGFDESMSAVTPSTPNSKGRARRRHGPAVSSAWPSSGNPLTGKLRGRPPSNRSVRDGPFSTFPANPKTREGPIIDLQGSTPVSTPVLSRQENSNPFQRSPEPGVSTVQGKPGGLHLHVPQHTGGVVRLATPTVVLNGALDQALSSAEGGHVPGRRSAPASTVDNRGLDAGIGYGRAPSESVKPAPIVSIKLGDLLQILATKLCNAHHQGGESHLVDVKLAQRLSDQVVADLRKAQRPPISEDNFVASCAAWFGLTSELGLTSALPGEMNNLQVVTVQTSDGSLDRDRLADKQDDRGASTGANPDPVTCYSLSWRVETGGGLTADCKIVIDLEPDKLPASAGPKDVSASAAAEAVDHNDIIEAEAWKQKYIALQRERDEEKARVRRKVLEAVL